MIFGQGLINATKDPAITTWVENFFDTKKIPMGVSSLEPMFPLGVAL
jgi:hypothetical protein